MERRTLLFFKLTLLFGRASAGQCDGTSTVQVREGNLGQSGHFNWLGVLHVHINEWDKVRIAMSGIVLIKIKYALANAGDVVKIPQNIFKTNCKAMFLAAQNIPWFVKPTSYVTHPDYEYPSRNSIAIIELNLGEVDEFPLTPLCLPTADTFRASKYLYLTGFTHDNEILEKVIYEIQYLDNKVCEELYNRTEQSQLLSPSAYLCGYALNSVTTCVWENGMVLVSNATGYFNLIGFGIHGPGCAAPARFIDLFPYFSWINSVTSSDEDFDKDFDEGYRRKDNLIPNVPIHELYTMKGSRRLSMPTHHEFERYPFDRDTLKFHLIEPSLDDKNILMIIPFNDTWEEHEEACSTNLIYSEYFELKASHGIVGSATYKLSLYDQAYGTCSCVRLTVHSMYRSEAKLSFKEEINIRENTGIDYWNTPEEIFRYFPYYERPEDPDKKVNWVDNDQLAARQVITDDDLFPRKLMNYDLYVKFEFNKQAIMKFEMFGNRLNHSIGWVLPRIRTTTEPPTTTKQPTTRLTTTTKQPKMTTTTRRRITTTTRRRITTTTKPRIKLRSGVQKTTKLPWGMFNWMDKVSKEAEVRPVADVEEVQDTESAARRGRAPGAVLVACWLVRAGLRRAFVIY